MRFGSRARQQGARRDWGKVAFGRPLPSSSDCLPRTFLLVEIPRFSTTVTYCFHMHASKDDLSRLGSNPILVEANSPQLSNGRLSQDTHIWSVDGQLLAVSNQLAFY
ncbi:MAG: hypothetical protein AB1408_00090 [Pseudomonadota bacterium]